MGDEEEALRTGMANVL